MAEPRKKGFFARLFDAGAPEPEPEAPAHGPAAPEAGRPEENAAPPPPVGTERAAEPAVPAALGEKGPPPASPAATEQLPTETVVTPPPSPPEAVPAEAGAEASGPARQSWFQRLRSGLSRSSQSLTSGITGVFTRRRLDEATLEEFEDILIQADLGLATATKITDALRRDRFERQVTDQEVRTVLADEVAKALDPVARPLPIDASKKPFVILMVGVNGSGKTTTIGKLAARYRAEGRTVMLAAGDTFRAAAIEQLKIWGERTGSPVVARATGADAAGLAFDAMVEAKKAGEDLLIIDTAGRLQNKAELMGELAKVIRVIRKHDPEAPHAVLLTLDATTGQNAMSQVEVFRDQAGVTGLVMTKLDGTARGGILVAIAAKFGLPVHFIGVGEQVDDLQPFSATEFARAIAGLDR
ncbi:signal recognition particle-docking protein FtsY [Propylenella binzhouense]|uniref:Signal recognition particle receptor FtsY n=1 Tax=Propylenella binzhouense TaxID=2555902 RepID=A0A964WUR9_9HYPH|nr:signal recognition particle-docking protein FtsY [Propylenella binzhouense]MYZ49308.1 signal recognition particle-docking protein FtsY [Propylenella binzhouense]